MELSYIDDDKPRARVLDMLRKHSSQWSGALGTIRATKHRIPLEAGPKPIRSMPYRKGPAMRETVAKEVNKMLNAGVIEPTSTEWASPVVFVPNKDGSLRFCVDCRRLNAKTAADSYPLPRMDDCIDSIGDAAIFTTVGRNSGYWHIPVAPEDRDKTKFTTHMGTFRHLRMPFGLKEALHTFQRALDIILFGVRWLICLLYLDDVFVFSRTHEEHAEHLDTVLGMLRTAGISLTPKKCSFFRPNVHYLGHVISPRKLSVADTAAEAFKTFTIPRTFTQVRSFLGACNVYRHFVKGFAKTARPLTNMTRKDAEPDFDNPTEAQLQAFEDPKARMSAPPILALPRYGRPFMIDTDASAYQLGCMLLRERDEANDWRPFGYWSCSLNDNERNYSAMECECFPVVWAVRTLRPYVEGTKFTV